VDQVKHRDKPSEGLSVASSRPAQVGIKRKADSLDFECEGVDRIHRASCGEVKDMGEILSSDSEDAEEDSGKDEGVQPLNLVLAQFEKVARSKSKWKCTLKEGIMNLNGRDHVFVKGGGELFW